MGGPSSGFGWMWPQRAYRRTSSINLPSDSQRRGRPPANGVLSCCLCSATDRVDPSGGAGSSQARHGYDQEPMKAKKLDQRHLPANPRRRRRTGWGPASPALPTARGDWALGRRPAPFVVEEPAPHRPELLVLLDVGADRMIAIEAVEPGSSPAAVAAWASGRLRPGIRLRVDHRALAQAVRRRWADSKQGSSPRWASKKATPGPSFRTSVESPRVARSCGWKTRSSAGSTLFLAT